MAAAAPILTLVATGVGAVMQISAASRQREAARRTEAAAHEARAIRERNAVLIEAEGNEQKRRMQAEHDRKMALARARTAASGVMFTGTSELYFADLEETHGEELDWLDYSTRSRIDQELHAGYYDYLTGMSSAEITRAGATATTARGVSTLVGGVSDFGDAYNWWQT